MQCDENNSVIAAEMVFPLFDIRIRWKRIKNRGRWSHVYARPTDPYVHTFAAGHVYARGRDARANAGRAVEIQAGRKAEVDSSPAGSQVRARSRYTRTRLASAGVPGGARRKPRTNVDTKPRPELLRTTVQRACVPRPDHGGPSERPGRANRFRFSRVRRVTSPREHEIEGHREWRGEDRDLTSDHTSSSLQLTDAPIDRCADSSATFSSSS